MKFDQSLKHLNWYNATNKLLAKRESCFITMEDAPERINKISRLVGGNDFFFQLGVTCSLVDVLVDIGSTMGIKANNLSNIVFQNRLIEVLKESSDRRKIILYRFNESNLVHLSILIRLIVELEDRISFVLIIIKDSLQALLRSEDKSLELLLTLIKQKHELL